MSVEREYSFVDFDPAPAVEKHIPNLPLSSLFYGHQDEYLNELALFVAHFNAIPNLINEIKIDCGKARAWFSEAFKDAITDQHYCKRYFNKEDKAPQFDDVFYTLYEDLLIDFDTHLSVVRFLFKKTPLEKVEALAAGIKKFRKKAKRKQPEISLLLQDAAGRMDLSPMPINRPKLSLTDNYNDDFAPVHKTIFSRLQRTKDKGLVLLHGKPGTGKTSYIRYLLTLLKKEVIFLPPNMATAITNPGLLSLLVDNPNSVLVIEDAENIITDRETAGGGSAPVSALLNLADGLLADCLNIQIICSFNTDLSRIDPALMRKGRLIARYEFEELTPEKGQALSDKLGFRTVIDGPMTLAQIYNQDDAGFDTADRKPRIGFGALKA